MASPRQTIYAEGCGFESRLVTPIGAALSSKGRASAYQPSQCDEGMPVRPPGPKSHPEFTVDSSSRDLIRELFERVEDLTARLDCLSRPPVPEAGDLGDAARQPGPRES